MFDFMNTWGHGPRIPKFLASNVDRFPKAAQQAAFDNHARVWERHRGRSLPPS